MTNFLCLPGLATGMTDRGKAYTDVLAGTLVLLNSFVMLIELEIEGYTAVTRVEERVERHPGQRGVT